MIPSSLALATVLLCSPAVARGQAVVQPLPGSTDADRLADTMRRLAVSPNNVEALLDAGELSLKIDDLSGAASLFARADKVDPRSARAKAGMATILVRAERPGEALRYFQQAEAFGIAPSRIAADRGLAYDLVGQQDRAQRDYRLALKSGADDETTRRYALSLGISGRKDEALAVLEPLVRKSDRGAWRARAFILAMNGDVRGGSTIATTMMPPGMAQGLQPFLQRLPMLGAVDRAFAVHFGEVRATPERLADARLTPALAPLAPEPQEPVALAANQVVAPVATRPDRRSTRESRRRGGRTEVASAVAGNAQNAVVPPVSGTLYAAAPTTQPVYVQPLPSSEADRRANARAGVARRPAAGVVLAATSTQSPPIAQPTTSVTPVGAAPVAVAPVQVGSVQPVPTSVAGVAPSSVSSTGGSAQAVGTALPSPAPTITTTNVAAVPSVPVTGAAPSVVQPVGGATVASVGSGSATVPADASVAVVQPAGPGGSTVQPGFVTAGAAADAGSVGTPPPPVRPAQDAVLARIIANLSIPASELGVEAPVRRPRLPSAGVAEAKAKADEDSADRREAVEKIAAADKEVVPASSPSTRRAVVRRGTPVAAAEGQDVETGRSATTGRRRAAGTVDTADEAGSGTGRSATPGRRRTAGAAANADEAEGASSRSAGAGRRGARTADADSDRPSATARKRGAASQRAAADEADDAADTPVKGGKATARREATARKSPAERRAAAAKDAATAKEAAEKKAAKAEPERIWVQVATGARQGDLAKAWSGVRTKAPDTFKGRSGYTTPLRATNRVVTGPFKTQEEAQAFVNGLAKKGVSASTFTSDAGQKLSKLPATK
ncbi:SPOR domain-containing protein [Sphingomonas gellani]|uniref:SPOR domain-containing protein n=1 Tax=Sphingomonas gellani TaxID=1166340 RepID=UPI000B0DCBBF|nr:SPOR domain-containing protein [Sphingomonas gellani]